MYQSILLLVLTIFVLIYIYLKSIYNFWNSRGVVGPKPQFFFGNAKEIMWGKTQIGVFVKNIYDEYKNQPLIGIYQGLNPILVIRDLDLMKTIFIKDFSKFADRGIEIFEKHEPLTLNLLNLEPKRWRLLRTKLTPIFTSGKLRNMFYLLVDCADQLDKYLDKYDNEIVDMRDIPARFNTDVIGVCAFGLEAKALEDENSEFRKMGRSIFETNLRNRLRLVFTLFFAPLYRHFFGYFLKNSKLQEFIIGITKDTMDYRETNNIKRQDFIDLLMELKKQPQQKDDIELNDKILAAQLFIFFAAGFETSSTTMSNCLYELAQNHSIQNKLREEIKAELGRADGKLTYDGIKNMKYLDKVFKETLRKYPPATILVRKSTVPYEFAGTGIKIPAGTKIWIPALAIQRDPKYFPKPDIFDPERFSDDHAKSHDLPFLAFGDGPRNCIGARFGTMQTKVGLIKVLQNHSVDVCEKTDLDYEINPGAFLLAPKNGIFLRIKKIK